MVFIIIGGVSLLLLFMIFLTLVDPVIQRCLDICLEQEQKGDDSVSAWIANVLLLLLLLLLLQNSLEFVFSLWVILFIAFIV